MLRAAIPDAQIELVFNDATSARRVLHEYVIHQSPLTWAAPLQADGNYRFVSRLRRMYYLALILFIGLLLRISAQAPRLIGNPERRSLFEAYARADLVLACGGGYIYAPAAGDGIAGWFSFMLAGCILAILSGRPLVLLPQSIGPLHDAFQRRAARFVVQNAKLTCVRETTSLAMLRDLGCGQRVMLLADMAFGMRSAPVDAAQSALTQLGALDKPAQFRVGITALNWRGQSAGFAGQSTYERAMLEAINTLTSQGALVILFAQCCGPSLAEDDRVVSRQLKEHATQPERVFLMDESISPDLLQAMYAEMDYFIGTRMHSVILALNAGIPALAIGYLHKTQSVLGDLGMQSYALDISSITAKALLERFGQLRESSGQSALAPSLEQARQQKQQLGQMLNKIGKE